MRFEVLSSGSISLIASGVSNSLSTPFRRLACRRRFTSWRSCTVWARCMTPRWLNMTLKFSSCDRPSQSLTAWLVDACALVPEVVGADDRGVAAGVAAAEPALLEHRDVGDAVLLGEIVGGGQAVAAGADDDHLVARLRLRAAPGRCPVLVTGESVSREGPDGIALHASLIRSKSDQGASSLQRRRGDSIVAARPSTGLASLASRAAAAGLRSSRNMHRPSTRPWFGLAMYGSAPLSDP